MFKVRVDIANDDTYGNAGDAAGETGIEISLKNGKIKDYLAVIPIYANSGYGVQYRSSNEKIVLYEGATEETKGSALANGLYFEFLVIGV